MIFGNVGADGAIISGTGFTVTPQGTGRYLINFTTPFPNPPTMLVSKIYGNPDVNAGATVEPAENAIVDQVTVNNATVATSDAAGALVDGSFGFLAQSSP
jgi:hypothetical protein